jgi:hypothetical protein
MGVLRVEMVRDGVLSMGGMLDGTLTTTTTTTTTSIVEIMHCCCCGVWTENQAPRGWEKMRLPFCGVMESQLF